MEVARTPDQWVLPAPADHRLASLVSYWDEKRAGRPMPNRSDIDPVDIPGLLPFLVLVELREPPRRFYYRLTGTWVDELYGSCLTGLYLEDLVETPGKAYWLEQYRRTAALNAPTTGATGLDGLQQDYNHCEWVMLPLAAPQLPSGRMILVGLSFQVVTMPVMEAGGAG